MSCKPSKILIWTLCLTFLATGCTPTKPLYLNETGNLSYYLDQATAIEYPDVETATLEEVTQAGRPITVIDPDFDSYFDLTLEDCVSIALQNSKVLRGYGTPSLQGTRVAPGQDNLANGPAAAGTLYNVAIRESEPGFIGTPGQISAPGQITTNTGLEGNQGVEAALADFDTQFTSSAFWSRTDAPRNVTPPAFGTPDRLLYRPDFVQDSVQWQAEFAKKSANGTQIFFRNVNLYTANNATVTSTDNPGIQSLDSWYRAALEVEIRQPLLRGRGAFIQRMPIVISRINTDQEIANLDAQLQNMVTNVELRYWELYCAYRTLETAKNGRNAALETWRIVKDRYDEGADVNIQQVAQASEQYHFFDAQVIDAFNNVLTSEGNLRWLLGIASTDCRIIRPIDDAVMAPVEFDWCSSLCEALTYRPELRQERWEIKKKELSLAYSKNGLLPELNVTALYRWLGLGNRYATSGPSGPFPGPIAGDPEFANQSGALNELYGGNYQEFQFGGEYRMPIGFRRELANVRNAQLKLAREVARLEDMELDVTRELSEAMRALATNQRIMQSAFSRWKDTTIEEDHFLELRDAGVETLDIALDSQRRRAQAELAFYTAICEYNKVIALIHRRKGTILPYNGICFSEGPWPGKAYIDAQEHARRRSASRQVNYGWSRPQVISRGEDSPTANNVGYQMGSAPTVTSPDVYYPENSLDPGMPIMDGEIINTPYYSPGEVIEQVIPDTLPDPSLAPPSNGSSSRNTIRNQSVQQASFTEPAGKPEPIAPVKQPARQQQPPLQRATASIRSERPLRDNPADSAKRLKAVPRTPAPPMNNTAAIKAPKTLPANTVRPSSIDWEKFGLTNPERGTETKAAIKQNNQ